MHDLSERFFSPTCFTGILHMEPSQPGEYDSKPLGGQFAFEMTAIFARIRMNEGQLLLTGVEC